jgi:hypothetical protein
MYRKAASYLAVLAIGMALGLGAVAVAQNQQPQAKASSDSQIVTAINRLDSDLKNNVGTSDFTPGLRAYLYSIKRSTAGTCRAAGSFSCGS